MPSASTGASTTVGAVPAVAPTASTPSAVDSRVAPGGPGYRRMSLALFLAGVATFALLYSTQALLPLISDGFGSTASAASWTVSAATGALALFVLPMSALSERFGRRTVMTASLVVAVAVGLLIPFAPSLGALVVLRAVQGAALAGVPASATAYLAEEVRPKALITAIGLFVAGNSVGGMSGRVVTGWVAQEWGWRVALGVLGVIAVGCAVAFRLLLPAPKHFVAGSLRPAVLASTVRAHLANPLLRRLYAIGALFMTVFGGVYTVIGYRLAGEPFSLPQGVIGSIFLVYLVGTVSASTAGKLVGRLGRRGTLYLAGATTATGLLVSLSDALPVVLLGLVLITAGFFAGHAAASSAVSHTAKEGRAQASALYQSAYYVGSSAGSTLGAIAFHAGGWGGTVSMGLLAVLGVVGITVVGSHAARRGPVPAH
ncbi:MULTISPECIES: MFS transporter [Streptomyces]|uniref:YNFM family putative membrane transporter n=1 Tax=Streptomyces stelliscabiei TaxID=146820 RepID=A0A8I0P4N1_9ACTN|nr:MULTISPECIES: MFS transporter [Streptomyces]KND30697.1 membrane protein [Streptomyces stelliscabiei]MBE1599606.1 YNFM family putative membrane transporter [Streptomyces stelliscabiei]MDX2519621.1 MFS transporter [Streptomyces stelliscabiei]MDX2553820.1 MFS transporter [Streptomyces stelliscabiei]MDX2612563.1 MFS transporter [Streptomyces stelliscabiei]